MRSISQPVHLSHTLIPDPPCSATDWEELYTRARVALPKLRRKALRLTRSATDAFERADAEVAAFNVQRIEAILTSSRFEISRTDYNVALQVVADIERGPQPRKARQPQPPYSPHPAPQLRSPQRATGRRDTCPAPRRKPNDSRTASPKAASPTRLRQLGVLLPGSRRHRDFVAALPRPA